MLHLPHAAGIVEAHKLRCKLGLQKVKIEEELVQKRLVNIEETVNFNEFARILRLDAKDPSVQQLFRIHDRANKGTIDIEEYMFTVLAIANANSVLDLVDIAFDVCDANGTKCLDTKKLRKALKLSLQLEPEESDRIFSQASHDVSGGEAVSFGKLSFIIVLLCITISTPQNIRFYYLYKMLFYRLGTCILILLFSPVSLEEV